MLRRWLAVLALLSTLLIPAPGFAAPASEAQFRAALKRCRLTIKKGKWKAALGRYAKLLQDHKDADYVRREVASIEDDLKICHFKTADKPPPVASLLGQGVVSYDARRRKLVLEYRKIGPPDWKATKLKRTFALEPLFAGDFILEIESERHASDVVVCGDLESLSPGYVFFALGSESEVSRVDPDGVVKLGSFFTYRWKGVARLIRRGSRFQLEKNGEACKFTPEKKWHPIASLKDGRHRKGRFAVRGTDVDRIRIAGVLDEDWLRQLLAGAESKRFEAWLEDAYDRESVLPAWLLRTGASASAGKKKAPWIPSDAPPRLAATLESAVAAFVEGDGDLVKKALDTHGSRLPTVTVAWLRALAAGHEGEIRQAIDLTGTVLEKEPEFGPAHALRGMALLHLRNEEEVATHISQARKLAPRFPLTVLLGALAALVDRDVEGADEVLATALANGIRTESLETFAKQIHRSRKGPNWTRRNRHESSHFVVESDHDTKVCVDVALRLEGATSVFLRSFPRRKTRLKKARVRVFSNRADYYAYGRAIGTMLEGSAGAYVPTVRELVLFVMPGSDLLDQVVRHEGFHWYVHELVDDLPIWFNEGQATCHETASRPNGPPTPNAINEMRCRGLGRIEDNLAATRLMLMDAETFMKNAGRNYARSWALVHLLRTTRKTALRGKLDAYYRAIRDGLSRKEAYETVFLPVVAVLEAEFRTHVHQVPHRR